jgi:hypothetical protein
MQVRARRTGAADTLRDDGGPVRPAPRELPSPTHPPGLPPPPRRVRTVSLVHVPQFRNDVVFSGWHVVGGRVRPHLPLPRGRQVAAFLSPTGRGARWRDVGQEQPRCRHCPAALQAANFGCVWGITQRTRARACRNRARQTQTHRGSSVGAPQATCGPSTGARHASHLDVLHTQRYRYRQMYRHRIGTGTGTGTGTGLRHRHMHRHTGAGAGARLRRTMPLY